MNRLIDAAPPQSELVAPSSDPPLLGDDVLIPRGLYRSITRTKLRRELLNSRRAAPAEPGADQTQRHSAGDIIAAPLGQANARYPARRCSDSLFSFDRDSVGSVAEFIRGGTGDPVGLSHAFRALSRLARADANARGGPLASAGTAANCAAMLRADTGAVKLVCDALHETTLAAPSTVEVLEAACTLVMDLANVDPQLNGQARDPWAML
jgi:hypothetical protein